VLHEHKQANNGVHWHSVTSCLLAERIKHHGISQINFTVQVGSCGNASAIQEVLSSQLIRTVTS